MTRRHILQAECFHGRNSLVFGMSTRQGGVSPEPYRMNLSFNVGDDEKNVRANRSLFFENLGILESELAVPKQVHSSAVRIVRAPGVYEECDALITDKHRVFLVVSVADCVPIFLFDEKRHVVAAVHAGWRGTMRRISERTVKHMVEDFGSNPSNIVTFVGPSAGECCYEVGEDVAKEFDRGFVRKENGKFFVNLKGANASQLVEGNIPPTNVEVSQRCTICEPTVFHSYRRDRNKSGRMMGVIGLA